MGMFKEEIRYLEDLAKQQVRIYSDACDTGVLATPEIKRDMRDILETLLSLEGSKVIGRQNDSFCVSRDYHLEIQWSKSEWTAISVAYINDKRAKKEFFTVDGFWNFSSNQDEEIYDK